MTFSLVWGEYTILPPDSEGIKIQSRELTSRRRMLDGTLKVDIIRQFTATTLTWSYLTLDERETVREAYDTNCNVPTHLILPDGTGGDFTLDDQNEPVYDRLVIVSDIWDESHFYDFGGNPRYTVTFTVEDV